jgi:cell division septation protein DedD
MAASFWYLQELRQAVVDGSSVPDLPSPPTLSIPRLSEPRVPNQETQMSFATEAPLIGRTENLGVAGRARTSGYVIQVASFQSRARASRLAEQLSTAGYRVHQVELNLEPPRGRLLQILVGGYVTIEEAQVDLARIRQIPGYADARLREVGADSLINR